MVCSKKLTSQSTMQLTEYEVVSGREIWQMILMPCPSLAICCFTTSALRQKKYKTTAWPAHSIIQTIKKRISSELLLPFLTLVGPVF